jgi:hypothetical protein
MIAEDETSRIPKAHRNSRDSVMVFFYMILDVRSEGSYP